MTNLEFYKNEIMKDHTDFCRDFVLPKILAPMKAGCSDYDYEDPNACTQCHLIQAAWLLEERKEPEVDWSTVPIDTPILVRDTDDEVWEKRHFAGVNENGNVAAWLNGYTSFTTTAKNTWKQAKLWEGSSEQEKEERNQEAADE